MPRYPRPAVHASMRKHPLFLAYVEAALWSSDDNSNDQGGDPLDKNYSIDDIDEPTLDDMAADCAEFIAKCNSAGLHDAILNGAEKQAGHDFWLTRNHHGAGFWDGDWGEEGDALTKIAHKFGEYNLYVGDDNLIYGMPG